MPDTTPVVAPTFATDGFALLHVPPATALLSVVVAPTHTFALPVIAGSIGMVFTVSCAVTLVGQPKLFVTVYVIVVVPAATPVTIPLKIPIVATAGVLLVHTPPVTALARVVVV